MTLQKTGVHGGDGILILLHSCDVKMVIHNGININPNYIFAINDPVLKFKGSTAEKKREAFKQFMDMGFNDFTFFDDDRENINIANSLNKEPGIKMKAKLIKQKWIPKFEDFK
jgi:hypothetical protein